MLIQLIVQILQLILKLLERRVKKKAKKQVKNAALLVITGNNRVVMVYNEKGEAFIPGGMIDTLRSGIRETSEQAAKREFHEETSVALDMNKITLLNSFTYRGHTEIFYTNSTQRFSFKKDPKNRETDGIILPTVETINAALDSDGTFWATPVGQNFRRKFSIRKCNRGSLKKAIVNIVYM